MIRGFKYLHHRLLAQDEVVITELEKRLVEADKHEAANADPNYRLLHTAPEVNGDTRHTELLEKIRIKLGRYSKSVKED